jgi:hypothetical protein
MMPSKVPQADAARDAARIADIFHQIDTNGDGKVTRVRIHWSGTVGSTLACGLSARSSTQRASSPRGAGRHTAGRFARRT